MRRIALQYALALFLISNGASAQQWYGPDLNADTYRYGNVGIGVATPGTQLHINRQNYGSILLGNNTSEGVAITKEADNRLAIWNNGQYGSSQYERFTLLQNGYIGIGTSSPTQTLDVRGNIYTNGSMYIDGGDLILARTTNDYGFIVRPASKPNLAFAVEGGGPLNYLSVNCNISYFSGGIGIGTASIGSYKLAVEGKIAARGVKVTTGSFADYVFEPTYKLRPLAHLEQYINQNKHLPGIPSAEEVKKEGGVELGEMNVKLLEKVEELTLYVIELKKENEQMKKEIKAIKRKK